MEEKGSSEMSLDDVLSSIKKMVVDEEPPVLELTEMVSEDGSIVSLKKKPSDSTEKKGNDMSAFLKLIQQEGAQDSVGGEDSSQEKPSKKPKDRETKVCSTSNDSIRLAGNTAAPRDSTVFQELILEEAKPLIKDWINNNLAQIVKDIVQKEVHDFLNKKQN